MPGTDPAQTGTTGGQSIRLTLEGEEGTKGITAALLAPPAAAEFAAHLPLSFHMTDCANREKHACPGVSCVDGGPHDLV